MAIRLQPQPVQTPPVVRRLRATYQRPSNVVLSLQDNASLSVPTLALFGAQTAAFLPLNIATGEQRQSDQFSRLNSPGAYEPDAPDGYSALGTPIYGMVMLGDIDNPINRYTDQQGKERSYTSVQLDCALVSIQYNPQIIKTDIQGLPYSIKEYISSGDNGVSITGIFNSTPDVAPKEFITNLNSIFNAQCPIPVTNWYLNDNGITHIVLVPGSSMWQEEGMYASQRFTIEAVSDVPMTQMLP